MNEMYSPKTGTLDEALQLYQRALRLDDSLSDTNASAEDWFAYGRFLEDAGFPARLAYACLVKSESATQSLHNAVQGYRGRGPAANRETAGSDSRHGGPSQSRTGAAAGLGASALGIVPARSRHPMSQLTV